MQHNYHEDFEGLLVRHDYAKRSGNLDKYAHEIKKHRSSIEMISRVVYNRNRATYDKVGYSKEDIVSISNMLCLYYMSLYSAKYNPSKRKKISKRLAKENKTEPSEKAIEKYDRHAMVRFIKHKHSRTNILCNSKAQNISVGKDQHLVFAETKDAIPASVEEIISNHKKVGYRKVTKKEFKEIHQASVDKKTPVLFDKDGFRILKVDRTVPKPVEYHLPTTGDGEFSTFYRSQSQIYSENHEGDNIESYRHKFKKMPKDQKEQMLKRFIKENKGKSYLSEELRAARKYLNSEIMV